MVHTTTMADSELKIRPRHVLKMMDNGTTTKVFRTLETTSRFLQFEPLLYVEPVHLIGLKLGHLLNNPCYDSFFVCQ
jgi:hypothetical protein